MTSSVALGMAITRPNGVGFIGGLIHRKTQTCPAVLIFDRAVGGLTDSARVAGVTSMFGARIEEIGANLAVIPALISGFIL